MNIFEKTFKIALDYFIALVASRITSEFLKYNPRNS